MKRLWVAALLLAAGCVYYNGMYNARRLTGAAEKAEREGRTLDASSYWGQVAVKAESVIVKHPDSKWADLALLLRGRALANMGQCGQAIQPLERALARLTDPEQHEQTVLTLARCRLELGDSAAATAMYAGLINSQTPAHRRTARLQYAGALIGQHQYQQALTVLDSVGGREARALRVVALGGVGRVPEAVALGDSALADKDTLVNWPAFLNAVGSRDPVEASRLVDTLGAHLKLNSIVMAKWYLADGGRLLATDTAAAIKRYEASIRDGGERAAAWSARLAVALLRLRSVRSVGDLAGVRFQLDTISKGDGMAADSAGQILKLVTRLQAVDSVVAGSPEGDLRLFYAGETARDSLGMRGLAAELFRQVPIGWPDSPYAPKALLVLIQLDPAFADSARQLLTSRYVDSPYLAIIRGDSAPGYRVLEDSMRTYGQVLATLIQNGQSTTRREVTPPRRVNVPAGPPASGRRLPGDAP